MPKLCAGEREFAVRCVVFDKDGTLLDFEQSWGQRTVTWIETMVRAAGGVQELANDLSRMLGYDIERRQVTVGGPISAGSAETIVTLAAGVLYAQYHLPWHEAKAIASETAWAAYGAPLSSEEIKPLGDVKGTIKRLREAGIEIAVATADNRDVTQRCLELLGIADAVATIICGDDPLPQKPDPGVLAHLAGELAIPPGEMLMVGDTTHDVLTGRNGGAAGCVAIHAHDLAENKLLVELADVVLPSIAGLQVCG